MNWIGAAPNRRSDRKTRLGEPDPGHAPKPRLLNLAKHQQASRLWPQTRGSSPSWRRTDGRWCRIPWCDGSSPAWTVACLRCTVVPSGRRTVVTAGSLSKRKDFTVTVDGVPIVGLSDCAALQLVGLVGQRLPGASVDVLACGPALGHSVYLPVVSRSS